MPMRAMISLIRSVRSDSRRATRAIWTAMPITRLVSGSKLWLSRNGVIGILSSQPVGLVPQHRGLVKTCCVGDGTYCTDFDRAVSTVTHKSGATDASGRGRRLPPHPPGDLGEA